MLYNISYYTVLILGITIKLITAVTRKPLSDYHNLNIDLVE